MLIIKISRSYFRYVSFPLLFFGFLASLRPCFTSPPLSRAQVVPLMASNTGSDIALANFSQRNDTEPRSHDAQLESRATEREEPQRGIEFSLPRVDGGTEAWLFLAGSFFVEALVWGTQCSLFKLWVYSGTKVSMKGPARKDCGHPRSPSSIIMIAEALHKTS